MAQPYPLNPDHFESACKAVKLEADPALLKALQAFFRISADQPEQRLAMLPKIARLAGDFRKSKAVAAAGPKAAKVVDDLIAYLPTERKERERDAQALRKTGAQTIDVQFKITDWNGRPFEGARAYVAFESPGVPTIRDHGKVGAASFGIDDIRLRPEGMVALNVDHGSWSIEGVADYRFKPGATMMKFAAVQHSQKYKTRARSLDEVKKKYGWKGTVGVEFKVLSIGGEASKESEYNQAREEEVEWELEAGLPTFKDFKQLA